MPNSLDRVLRNVAVAGRASLDASVEAVVVGESPADAYDRGFSDGVVAGRREGAAIGEAAASGVQMALDAVRSHIAELRLTQADALVSTALEVAEFILGAAPAVDHSILMERIGSALRALDDEPLTVLLNPVDREAFADDLTRRFEVSVEADPTLGPGEARIRGSWSRADLTRDTALAVVRETLT